MHPMFTRRTFVGMTAAALAAHTLQAQDVAGEGQASTQFSVMIWTLKKLGTFEENLDRVAQAGFHHVELGVNSRSGRRMTIAASWRACRN